MRNKFQLFLLLFVGCIDYEFHPPDPKPPGGDDTAPSIVDTHDSAPPPPTDPVAVCDVTPSPIAPPWEAATWIGENSYDPDGGLIVSYNWTLVSSPAGSTVTMPTGGSNRPDFVPVLAGEYVGQLIVSNASGDVSEPCTAILDSIPAQNLWIEMYWEHPDDDMDLHLIAPGGTYNNLYTDCYYANCTPSMSWIYNLDWGNSGYDGDDPSLDLDDIMGAGPENINILDPQTNGVYTVIVHDYQGSTSDVYGANNVTVNIYLNGSLTWTDTKAISGDNTVNEFAEIDWSSGTVTSL